MFLRRVQVPDFRVLKDVDITFEPEFSPCIFPLGSLNGGGKSTLLQLIFILLSCSGDSDKHIFIQNMLEGFVIEEDKNQKLLAAIHLSDRDKDIKIQFFCHKNEIPTEQINTENKDQELLDTTLKFSTLGLDKKMSKEIDELEKEIASLKAKYIKICKIKTIEDNEERNKILEKEINNSIYGNLGDFIRNLFKIKNNVYNVEMDLIELQNIENTIVQRSQDNTELIKHKKRSLEQIDIVLSEISRYLEYQNLVHICNYINLIGHKKEEYALLCNIEPIELGKTNNLLQKLSSKIFLAAPLTQIFLFLPKDNTKLLFKESNYKKSYYSKLEDIKGKLPNLFTYDILSVDYIIESFKTARDKDFKQAIETGEYGNAYKSILKDLNSLLSNKRINIDTDLSGVNFKIDRDGETKELYPEDLSHGELKRLSIYVWLKYKEIKDSIVLIDEIENAFHPDWQYQIISDLAEWGKTNQYILATHSYELCQALTPAHVKELEPKLLTEEQGQN